jgi:hypothetical protein
MQNRLANDIKSGNGPVHEVQGGLVYFKKSCISEWLFGSEHDGEDIRGDMNHPSASSKVA